MRKKVGKKVRKKNKKEKDKKLKNAVKVWNAIYLFHSKELLNMWIYCLGPAINYIRQMLLDLPLCCEPQRIYDCLAFYFITYIISNYI